jgi:hypothetical protein
LPQNSRYDIRAKIIAIEKKPKSFHRGHRQEVPGGLLRDWLHHLLQVQGSKTVN